MSMTGKHIGGGRERDQDDQSCTAEDACYRNMLKVNAQRSDHIMCTHVIVFASIFAPWYEHLSVAASSISGENFPPK